MTTAPTARRTATLALSVPLLALTAACGSGGAATASPTPATSTTPAATSSATSSAASSTTTSSTASPASSSSPANGAPVGIPAGAGTATTVDLDGDGAPDTLWLGDVDGRRELGVASTGHGGSSIEFTSAAPQSATATAAVLASGAPVVFLNTGRSVQLYVYRVENSGLVPVKGVDGQQYSFSLGFTDYGTGLTCEEQTDGLHLFGENAVSGQGSGSDDTFTVERTEVTVSAEHSLATNGQKTTVGTGLSSDDPKVQAAHGTTCGDVTDAGTAKEPM